MVCCACTRSFYEGLTDTVTDNRPPHNLLSPNRGAASFRFRPPLAGGRVARMEPLPVKLKNLAPLLEGGRKKLRDLAFDKVSGP